MIHPVTAMLHYKIAHKAMGLEPKSIIDIGGVGKLRSFIDCKIADANKSKGFDGTNLKFPDNSFDIAVSVATLEHVNNQQKFINESIRVAKIAAIHWFPYGNAAVKTEEFKKRFKSYNHPCSIPTNVDKQHCTPFVTVSEHLLLLATLYKEINCEETYCFINKYGCQNYGTIMVINK